MAPELRPVDIRNDVELRRMPLEGLEDGRLERPTSPAEKARVDEPRDSTTDKQNRPGHIVWAADAGHGQSLRIPSPLAQEKGMTSVGRHKRRKLIIITQVQNLTLSKPRTATRPLIMTKTQSQSHQESHVAKRLKGSPYNSGVPSPEQERHYRRVYPQHRAPTLLWETILKCQNRSLLEEIRTSAA